jgi:hypothetical protein
MVWHSKRMYDLIGDSKPEHTHLTMSDCVMILVRLAPSSPKSATRCMWSNNATDENSGLTLRERHFLQLQASSLETPVRHSKQYVHLAYILTSWRD